MPGATLLGLGPAVALAQAYECKNERLEFS